MARGTAKPAVESATIANEIVQWVHAGSDIEPLSPEMVPGADDSELRLLSRLGGLARAIAVKKQSADSRAWPEEIWAWMQEQHPPDALVDRVLEGMALRGDDPLARTYEAIVRPSHRRELGTFFTPPVLVQHMMTLACSVMESPPTTVVDPGAGVGAFTVAALDTWPDAMVWAVDINAVTLGLLAIRCAVAPRRVTGTLRMSLLREDYLDWVTRGLDALPAPRLVLGNPPYTRHQLLSPKTKALARRAAGDLVTSGLAGMSAYVLAASVRVLGSQDGLCLLLPGNWAETRYGQELREHLWAIRHRKVEVHAFPRELQVFPGTQVTAVILAIGPRRSTLQPFRILPAHMHGGSVATGRVRLADRRAATPSTFSHLFWPNSRPAVARSRVPMNGPRLTDVVRIRRGVATGANSFFLLSDDEAKDLPPTSVTPVLRRMRDLLGEALDAEAHDSIGARGGKRWLLDLHDAPISNGMPADPRLRRLVQRGRDSGMHLRVLCAVRDPWFAVERIEPPDLFISPMSKDAFRVATNLIRAVHTNSLYGLYVNGSLGVEEVANWLRSSHGQERLRAVARQHSSGLLKLEPRALGAITVPWRQESLSP